MTDPKIVDAINAEIADFKGTTDFEVYPMMFSHRFECGCVMEYSQVTEASEGQIKHDRASGCSFPLEQHHFCGGLG